MLRYLGLVIGLSVLSLLAVALLSPTQEEKLERALSRLSPAAATAALDRIYAAGDRSPNLLLRRAEIKLANAEPQAARTTLEALAAIPGQELLGAVALARLEIELGDVAAAANELERAQALQPEPERLDELARLLELSRLPDRERSILAAAEPTTLTDRSATRLLELLAADGDMVEAERLLRVRAETPGQARDAMRGALAELLAGSERADEAALLAARWLARDGDADALALVVERLLERGFLHQATTVARAAVASGRSAAHAVIPVFAGAGHGLRARALLRDWLALNERPDQDETEALLRYAAAMNDYSALRALLRRMPAAEADPDLVLGVVQGSYRRFGPAALSEYRRHITPDVLAADPLFAAEIALAQRNPRDATVHLEAAAAQGLTQWQTATWNGLARQVTEAPLRSRLLRAGGSGSPPAEP